LLRIDIMHVNISQAGIDPDRLQLAYEPEAASLWCQHETSDARHALSKPGTQYMVVDLGGEIDRQDSLDIVVNIKPIILFYFYLMNKIHFF